MIQEIVYTSAPKGLRKGSRGFCTVISTSGMAVNLAERLESMSGYRHAFALNSAESHLNPVNYSHVTTRLEGQNLHVISRIAAAGQDYTGRTNKLAHHIVIDSVHSLPAGPARLLADSSVIYDQWDGTVTQQPARAISNPLSPQSVTLTEWNHVAADAGWAGYVAEHLMTQRSPIYVLFPAGTNTLKLTQEIFDLLPAGQRWRTTFSTYFTRLLPGTECQLRFVLDETQEARTLRNDVRAIKVDLCKNLPAATDSDWVSKARTTNILLSPAQPQVTANDDSTTAAADNLTTQNRSDEELNAVLSDSHLESQNNSFSIDDDSTKSMRGQDLAPEILVNTQSQRLNAKFGHRPRVGGHHFMAFFLGATLFLVLIATVVWGGPKLLAFVHSTTRINVTEQPSSTSLYSPATQQAEEQSISEELVFAKPAGQEPHENTTTERRQPFAEYEHLAEYRWLLPKLSDVDSNAVQPPKIWVGSKDQLSWECEADFSVSNTDSGWQITDDKGQEIGQILAIGNEADGISFHWEWSERDLQQASFRQAILKLNGCKLNLKATNTLTDSQENLCIYMQLPTLWDDAAFAKPLLSINKEQNNGPLLWQLGDKISVAAFPEEIQIQPTGNTSIFFRSVRHENTREWILSDNQQDVITIDCPFDGKVSQLTWRWHAGQPPEQNSDVLYRLAQFHWAIQVDRSDLQQDRLEVQPQFPKTIPVLTASQIEGSLPLFELPNPNPEADPGREIGQSLSLRAPQATDVLLELHPQFSAMLAENAESTSHGYELQLQQTKDSHQGLCVWQVYVVSSAGPTSDEGKIEIGQYRVRKIDEQLDTCRLSFYWDKREGKSWGDWLRWCPLIINISGHSTVFAQRRAETWIGQKLLKNTVIFEPALVDPARSGSDFRGLKLTHAPTAPPPVIMSQFVLTQRNSHPANSSGSTEDEGENGDAIIDVVKIKKFGTDMIATKLYFGPKGLSDTEPIDETVFGQLEYKLVLKHSADTPVPQTRLEVTPKIVSQLPKRPAKGTFPAPAQSDVMSISALSFANSTVKKQWDLQKTQISASPKYQREILTTSAAKKQLAKSIDFARNVQEWSTTYIEHANQQIQQLEAQKNGLTGSSQKIRTQIDSIDNAIQGWTDFRDTTSQFQQRWLRKPLEEMRDQITQLAQQMTRLDISGTISVDYGDGIIVDMIQIQQEASGVAP